MDSPKSNPKMRFKLISNITMLASFQVTNQNLDKVNLPKLSLNNQILLDQLLKIDEMTKALKSMEISKSPGDDGFTVKFYRFFLNDLEYLL